ncbi:MAG: ABC transporter ATP-binding protein [Vulcanococcus sp.]|uniref:ABC transporter ATP-binding protein n=1 Tax=Vulcanococcus sp. TaxID=2856995 RepID=UPI0025E6476A|nr:ABC transporter ATP-binding protein [Vulcanococcus sp.]MBW0167168.1 ABC transporter ATP-binding protein [Vulcanococcus sp.]
MTTAIAIQAENLGKCYRIFNSPRARLAQGLWGQRRQLYQEKWALQDVSFELPCGQTLGVIGRNGSGKSTLLQLLCGTLTPTQGRVHCNGRIAALLELGSGFNPEFSGLENVFLNASLLGLTQRETEEKLDDILAFADIGDYINQPIKTYSSGMAVRLAFAVQANINPDILIVDEALAVGDELFQKKCYTRLSQLKASGTSILLVTHSCAQIIQHCDLALLLHKGRPQLLGKPTLVTTTYQQLANAPDDIWESVISRKRKAQQSETIDNQEQTNEKKAKDLSDQFDVSLIPQSREIYTSHGIEIQSINIETPEGIALNQIRFRSAFQLRFTYASSHDFEEGAVSFGCYIANTQGIRVTGQVYPSKSDIHIVKPSSKWEIVFSFSPGLLPGAYFVGGGVWSSNQHGSFIHRVIDYAAFRVLYSPECTPAGICDLSAGPAEVISET